MCSDKNGDLFDGSTLLSVSMSTSLDVVCRCGALCVSGVRVCVRNTYVVYLAWNKQ